MSFVFSLTLLLLLPFETDQKPPPNQTSSSSVTLEQAIKDDLEAMKGRWKMISGNLPPAFMEQGYVEFDGDRMFIGSGMERKELRIVIDPAQQPKHIDLLINRRLSKGIYELEKGTLRLCYEVEANAERPKRFTDLKGPAIVLVLEKEK